MEERATECLRVLDALGGRAEVADIWRRLHRAGLPVDRSSVRAALYWMARKRDPAAVIADRDASRRGKPGTWEITDRGRRIIGR